MTVLPITERVRLAMQNHTVPHGYRHSTPEERAEERAKMQAHIDEMHTTGMVRFWL